MSIQKFRIPMNLQLLTVDSKTVPAVNLAKVRDVDFAERFTAGIKTLMKMLGVTRKSQRCGGEGGKDHLRQRRRQNRATIHFAP